MADLSLQMAEDIGKQIKQTMYQVRRGVSGRSFNEKSSYFKPLFASSLAGRFAREAVGHGNQPDFRSCVRARQRSLCPRISNRSCLQLLLDSVGFMFTFDLCC